MPIDPFAPRRDGVKHFQQFIGRLLVVAILVRLVQARESRKCEYQNRYCDPEYFVHKSPRWRTKPPRGLGSTTCAVYTHLCRISPSYTEKTRRSSRKRQIYPRPEPPRVSLETILTPQFRHICSLEHGTTDTKPAVKTSTNAYISGTTKATQASAAT